MLNVEKLCREIGIVQDEFWSDRIFVKDLTCYADCYVDCPSPILLELEGYLFILFKIKH